MARSWAALDDRVPAAVLLVNPSNIRVLFAGGQTEHNARTVYRLHAQRGSWWRPPGRLHHGFTKVTKHCKKGILNRLELVHSTQRMQVQKTVASCRLSYGVTELPCIAVVGGIYNSKCYKLKALRTCVGVILGLFPRWHHSEKLDKHSIARITDNRMCA